MVPTWHQNLKKKIVRQLELFEEESSTSRTFFSRTFFTDSYWRNKLRYGFLICFIPAKAVLCMNKIQTRRYDDRVRILNFQNRK